MVKSVLGVNHKGLTDWLIQRVSAVVMVIYSVGLFIFLFNHADLAFYDWHGLFAHLWMKVASLLVLLSLMYHAWIGMWSVLTDYVKPYVLSLTLHVVIFLSLIAFFIEGALILWSV
jgi:succinate dehydrogenase / fumarate reductase membrane anchor subunit